MMDVLIKTINQNRTNEPVPGHRIPKISGKYVRITSEIELTYTTKHSSDTYYVPLPTIFDSSGRPAAII